jgi:hypothetical protein
MMPNGKRVTIKSERLWSRSHAKIQLMPVPVVQEIKSMLEVQAFLSGPAILTEQYYEETPSELANSIA